MTPYERVKLSRERTAATFPLPSVLDCIRYAITELAEYEDALLRQERASDKRNNDKQHDPRSELGQALYMLLSAAVQFGEPSEPRRLPAVSGYGPRELYFMALSHLADLGYEALDEKNLLSLETWLRAYASQAYTEMCDLAVLHGWPVDSLIDDTCAAFERKLAPKECHQ